MAFKDIDYVRQTYLPGPHMLPIKKLSGQPQTPVLQIDDRIISGSARILETLEQLQPSPTLLPNDPLDRKSVLLWQEIFDAELGPAVRTILFEQLIDQGSYLVQMFGREKPRLSRWAYRAIYPIAKPLIAKSNGVTDPANIDHAKRIVTETLDEINAQIVTTGYLVGKQFTLADLTAAALIAPIAGVDHVDMARPQPMPPGVAQLIANYADHPAIRWVQEIYNRHRK